MVLDICTGEAEQDVLEVTWLGKKEGQRDISPVMGYEITLLVLPTNAAFSHPILWTLGSATS